MPAPASRLTAASLHTHTASNPASTHRTVASFLAQLGAAGPPLSDDPIVSPPIAASSDLPNTRSTRSRVALMRSRDNSASELQPAAAPSRKRKRDLEPVKSSKRKKAEPMMPSDEDDERAARRDERKQRRQANAVVRKDRSTGLAHRILHGKLKPDLERAFDEGEEDEDEDAAERRWAKREKAMASNLLGPMAGRRTHVGPSRITTRPGFLGNGAASGRKAVVPRPPAPLADLGFDEATFLNRSLPSAIARPRLYDSSPAPSSRRRAEEPRALRLDEPLKWRAPVDQTPSRDRTPTPALESPVRSSPHRSPRSRRSSRRPSARNISASPAPSAGSAGSLYLRKRLRTITHDRGVGPSPPCRPMPPAPSVRPHPVEPPPSASHSEASDEHVDQAAEAEATLPAVDAVASRTPTSHDPELHWLGGFRPVSEEPRAGQIDDFGDIDPAGAALDNPLDELGDEEAASDFNFDGANEAPYLDGMHGLGDDRQELIFPFLDEDAAYDDEAADAYDEPVERMFGEGRAALLGFDALPRPPASGRVLADFWYRARP